MNCISNNCFLQFFQGLYAFLKLQLHRWQQLFGEANRVQWAAFKASVKLFILLTSFAWFLFNKPQNVRPRRQLGHTAVLNIVASNGLEDARLLLARRNAGHGTADSRIVSRHVQQNPAFDFDVEVILNQSAIVR